LPDAGRTVIGRGRGFIGGQPPATFASFTFLHLICTSSRKGPNMEYDAADLSPRERYKVLTSFVLPRPIAWVTSLGPTGVVNAAPFSFFNVFSEDPPLCRIISD
jgi:hypothetical protein